MSICFTISNECSSSGSKQQWTLSSDNNNVHGNWSNHINKSSGKRQPRRKHNTTTNLRSRTRLLISSWQKLVFTGAELRAAADPLPPYTPGWTIRPRNDEMPRAQAPWYQLHWNHLMLFQERQALFMKDLMQLHQSHGQLFLQTTLQWGIAHHTQEPLITQHLPPHKLKFLPLDISHPKTHCWPDFQQCATTEESPVETATNAAESNLGV